VAKKETKKETKKATNPTEAWHDSKTWHDQHKESMTFGQRLSDSIASGMGSWRFIIIQTTIVGVWIVLNLVEVLFKPFDPYPFILLNLLFSTQAAYAAPIIMMSQNRSAQRDRFQADADFQTNRDSKKEIEEVQKHLSAIEVDKLDKILALAGDDRLDRVLALLEGKTA
jgi:uncharacterized membrane protein